MILYDFDNMKYKEFGRWNLKTAYDQDEVINKIIASCSGLNVSAEQIKSTINHLLISGYSLNGVYDSVLANRIIISDYIKTNNL